MVGTLLTGQDQGSILRFVYLIFSFYSPLPRHPGTNVVGDPSRVECFYAAGSRSGAGHATAAAIVGASERSIMLQTGHRSVQMVRRFIRGGSLFTENSAGKLGL